MTGRRVVVAVERPLVVCDLESIGILTVFFFHFVEGVVSWLY